MGNQNDHLITPQLVLPAGTAMRMRVWDIVESSSYLNSYSVLVSTTGTAIADFTDTLASYAVTNTSWTERTVDLSAYTGQTIYISMWQSFSAATFYGFGLDDFVVEATPNCLTPTANTATSVLPTSAQVNWAENGTATSWRVEWDTAGYAAGTARNSVVVLTDTFLAVTALTAQTNYDWNVKALCSATDSSIQSSGVFATPCVAFTAPFNENFDGLALSSPYTDLPACWTPQVGPDYWDVTDDIINTGHSYLPNIGDHTSGSGNYMWIDASGDITANMMETPLIDMSGLTTPQIGFWFASNNTTNTFNHTINLDAWNGSAWVNVATQSGNFTGWVEVSGALPAGVPTTTKFRIQAIAATGTTSSNYYFNDLGIDDFFVIETPSCLSVTSLSLDSIAATAAKVSWTESGTATQWEVEYGVAGYTPGTSSNSAIVNTTPTAVFTGLMANTSYGYNVRAICGVADTAGWVGNSFFTGYCSPSPSNTDGSGIIGIAFDTVNNVTGLEAGGYGDYSSISGDITTGATVALDITYGTGYTYVTEVWIDWNDDLDFNDAGENVYSGTSLAANPTTLNATFIVPAAAPIGQHRMRIGGADVGPPTPCYSGSWASFEDYTVNVVAFVKAPIDLPITWEDTTNVDYSVIDFGGNASAQAVDPTNTSNLVLQSIKTAGAQTWAGTSLGNSLGSAISFSAGNTTIRALVYSPTAGIEVRLKVEDQTNGAISVETGVQTTVANGWDTLNFDLSLNVANTPVINFANTYDKMSIFYNFGVSPVAADTFFVDYVALSNPPAPAVDPYYPIATINTEDATGVADSLGVFAFTSGTVVGIDLDGNNGVSFTIVDMSTGTQEGMNIYNFNDVSGYVVTEGDSILVHGDIRQFNGLTQLFPDSISIISTGNAIPAPIVVTNLDETTESRYVSIPTTWVSLSTSGSFSSNISLTNGTDTITMRIDSDTDINDSLTASTPIIPGDSICGLFGIGGQFDNSAPRTSGYQIFPMRWSDLTICRLYVPPYYPVAVLNTEDAAGVADSLGVFAFTSGTVVGIDLDGNNGVSFTIIDMSTGTQEGMNIYNFNDVSGYVVAEGDSILVHGDIIQFNGLTELFPDSISIISTGNAIPAPIVVTNLDETTESRYVSIPTTWVSLSTSGAFSSNVDLTNGTDTITMRIDSDTDINDSLTASGNPIVPGDSICGLFGIGGQFYNSSPYTGGYQIFPMRWSDLTICRNTVGIEDRKVASAAFELVPNPTNGLFEIRSSGFSSSTINVSVRDISGRLISSQFINNANGNFSKSFDLNGESKGIYFITIMDGENVINKKLILQ